MLSRPASSSPLTLSRCLASCECQAVVQPSAGKLWGGRFTGATDPVFEAFNASIGFDRRLWAADIAGSRAYASALARAGVISELEADTLRTGLSRVGEEWQRDAFVLQPADEDIHTANERRLSELVGAVAGKLHTGRSRNDQVATDVRLFLLTEIAAIRQLLLDLILAVCSRAEAEVDVLMAGYTHLQPAQPIRWSHFLLSHAAAWQRDADRLADLTRRVSVLPLGSGALAGNAFPIDRQALAADLGFSSVSANSVDAVSDRDFIAEFLFFASLTQTHISQCCEDLILYSQRRLLRLSDAYSTGSSLMPQKRNPDAAELLRAKAARSLGSLVSVLTLLKALPRAYNKDLQEDKEPLFDSVLTLGSSVAIMRGVLDSLIIDRQRMQDSLSEEMLATDLAEYLVRKGVPFRSTHHAAGRAVRLAEERGVGLWALTVHDLKAIDPHFDEDVLQVWNYDTSVESRDVVGGTSKRSQMEQIEKLRAWAKDYTGEQRTGQQQQQQQQQQTKV